MEGVVIFGCGDIGCRVAKLCQADSIPVTGVVRTADSASDLGQRGINAYITDLDLPEPTIPDCCGKRIFYMVPPNRAGDEDSRSRNLIRHLDTSLPGKVVLISTTGVYGDCAGEWVDENRSAAPSTPRARRRLDAEIQWTEFSLTHGIPLTILRVPGIYSRSRIPRKRLESGIPVINSEDCGWSNRIHADDLVRVCMAAMQRARGVQVFNVSDGKPGSITEYLIAASRELGLEAPRCVGLAEAQDLLSGEMLSYLRESRRIDNSRMLRDLGITPRYTDLADGLKHG